MKKKFGIPEGWLPVSPVGKPVNGTNFVPFKVPLKETMCKNLQPSDRFSPAILRRKLPNLRLVIDLTNTMRYYDKNEFTQNGIKYMKIMCPGKQIPNHRLMRQFFSIVDNFMKRDTAGYIGVHCTHGINRTGYFICTYMIQKMGFNPVAAISAFQDARGHDIYRDYFIQALIHPDGSQTRSRTNSRFSSSAFPNSDIPNSSNSRDDNPPRSRTGKQKFKKNRNKSFQQQIPFDDPSSYHRRYQDRQSYEPRRYHPQSQLNYYEEENNHPRRRAYRWRNFKGEQRQHYNENN